MDKIRVEMSLFSSATESRPRKQPLLHRFDNCVVSPSLGGIWWDDGSNEYTSLCPLPKTGFFLARQDELSATDAICHTGVGLQRDWFVDGEGVPEPPALRDLLVAQGYADMRSRLVFYGILGRTLLPVGHLDDWGLITLLSGVTQSGKSTLLEALASAFFPEARCVGILPHEPGPFSLSALYDKDLVVADDVVDGTTFDNYTSDVVKDMASGAPMGLSRCHQAPIRARWSAPIIIASNYGIAGLVGDGGEDDALARRFVVFEFPHRLQPPLADGTKGDEPLRQKLLRERGEIFAICLYAYHKLIAEVGSEKLDGPKR